MSANGIESLLSGSSSARHPLLRRIGLQIRNRLGGLIAWIPPSWAAIGVSTPVKGRLLLEIDRALARHPRQLTVRSTAAGVTLTGSTSDPLLRWVKVFGTWEPNITAWVQRFLREGDVVIDVGANVGYFSLVCARQVGTTGQVFAVEPVPTAVAAARANAALNPGTNVRVLDVAAAEAAGDITLFVDSSNLLMTSSTPSESADSQVTVRKAPIASEVPTEFWSRTRLVKVDVEGEEINALRGLEPILKAMPSQSAVIVEVTPDWLAERGTSTGELLSILTDTGFTQVKRFTNSYDRWELATRPRVPPVPISEMPSEPADLVFEKV